MTAEVQGITSHGRLAAIASLMAAMILWSTSFVVIKAAITSLDPFVLVFGRMLVASICFLPVWIVNRRQWRLVPGSLACLAFMSICEPCLYFICEVKALVYTTASQAGMITAMLPVMVALGAYLFLQERLTNRTILGFVLAIGGAFWLSAVSRATDTAPSPVLGNFLEFLAMICATGYILAAKRLSSHYGYSPWFLTAIQAFVGCVFYLPLLWLPSTLVPHSLDWPQLLAVIYLGAFVTIGAYGCYNFGISRVPVSQASIFINLIPVFTLIMGWIFLHERFTPYQYAAAILIFAGIYLGQEEGTTPAADKQCSNAAAGVQR